MLFKNKKPRIEGKMLTANRRDMIKSRHAAMTRDTKSDYEICKYYYEYLREKFKDSDLLTSIMKGSNLSIRNMVCMRSVVCAMEKGDESAYWHELVDFIENYNSVEPVSYDEYQIFCMFFELKVKVV